MIDQVSNHVGVIWGAGSSVPIVPTAATRITLLLGSDAALDSKYAELFTWIHCNLQSRDFLESLRAECLRCAGDPPQRSSGVALYLEAIPDGARAIGPKIVQRLAEGPKTTLVAVLLQKMATIADEWSRHRYFDLEETGDPPCLSI